MTDLLVDNIIFINEPTIFLDLNDSASILGVDGDIRQDVAYRHLAAVDGHAISEIYIVLALALMVFSSVTCVCFCLLYHKYQQWHEHILESTPQQTVNIVQQLDDDTLPSYTIVTGLPSYEEAIAQLREMRLVRQSSVPVMKYAGQPPVDEVDKPTIVTFTHLSVGDLVKFHKHEKCEFFC